MYKIAVWMGSVPAGEGIGAVAGMNKCECSFYGIILQILVKKAELPCCEHAFVDNSPA